MADSKAYYPTVFKSNAIVEASYKLSLNEQRLVLFSIAKFNMERLSQPFKDYAELAEAVTMTFNLAEFAETFPDMDKNAIYHDVKQAIDELGERWVTVTRDGDVKHLRWISSKTYYHDEARLAMTFSPEIMPYLRQLKGKYTKYLLNNVAGFKSTYSIRLYELLAQYRNSREQAREITVQELREWFGVTGKYKNYTDFYKKTVEIALRDINEKSDVTTEVTPIKKGRTVHALRFEMKWKNPPEPVQAVEIEQKTANATPAPTTLNRRLNRPKLATYDDYSDRQDLLNANIKILDEYKAKCEEHGEQFPASDQEKLDRYRAELTELKTKPKAQKAKKETKAEREIKEQQERSRQERAGLHSSERPTDPNELKGWAKAEFQNLWLQRIGNKTSWGKDHGGDTEEKLSNLLELANLGEVTSYEKSQVESAYNAFLAAEYKKNKTA